MATGYITELIIPGFGGGGELWMSKIGTVETGEGSGNALTLSSEVFTIIDDTENMAGNVLIDTATFISAQLLCWRKAFYYTDPEPHSTGEDCRVKIVVTPEYAGRLPEYVTFSFSGGVYEYGLPDNGYFEFGAFDENDNVIGSFFLAEHYSAPYDLTETITLDYVTYNSTGLKGFYLNNQMALY